MADHASVEYVFGTNASQISLIKWDKLVNAVWSTPATIGIHMALRVLQEVLPKLSSINRFVCHSPLHGQSLVPHYEDHQ